MPSIVNPADALPSFILAYEAGRLAIRGGSIHPDIVLHVDQPNEKLRFTYGLLKEGKVVGTACLVTTGFSGERPCLDIGYAVLSEHRKKGYATELVRKAIEEAAYGFASIVPDMLLFAVIDQTNDASNAVARKFFSESPKSSTEPTGEETFIYKRDLIQK